MSTPQHLIQKTAQRSAQRSGSALITVLIISVAIAGIMMSLVDTSVSNLTREQRREQQIRRQSGAETAANIVLLGVQQATLATRPNTAITLSTSRTTPPMTIDLTAATSNATAIVTAIRDTMNQTTNMPASFAMTQGANGLRSGGTTLTAKIFPLPWDFTTSTCLATGSVSKWLIQATAQDGTADQPTSYDRHRVEIRVTANPTTIAGKGLFSANNYEFKGSATTDSWNSAAGPFNSSSPGSNGNIYAISGLPLISNSGVSGNAYQTSDPMPAVNIPNPLPGIALPASITTGSGRSAVTRKILVGGTTYQCIGSLPNVSYVVGSGGDVTIYVAGEIDLSNPVTFVDPNKSSNFTPGNRLWIYQTDYGAAKTNLNGNAISGNSADPGRVIIQSAFSGEITFNGSASLGAVLIAPNATLKLNGNFDFFGCLWVGQMYQDQVTGNFKFHYDDFLDNFQFSNTPSYSVNGWRSYVAGYKQQ